MLGHYGGTDLSFPKKIGEELIVCWNDEDQCWDNFDDILKKYSEVMNVYEFLKTQ